MKILFIDDDIQCHKSLKLLLSEDYTVDSAFTGRQGQEKLLKTDFDLVLLDIGLPDTSGVKLLSALQNMPGLPPVIMLTADSDIQTVVSCILKGAAGYLTKPLRSEQILSTLENTLIQNLAGLDTDFPVSAPGPLDSLMGESKATADLKRLILKYARSSAAVLIQGESGTGKELAAHIIHDLSGRSGSFLAVNCGAFPDGLIESELFGSEKGAYTDAVARAGVFEQAHGGTLFLDEVGEMSLPAQVKLLRVLETHELTRLGAKTSKQVDVRIIAATNRDLWSAKNQGNFREDLYYRLNVLPVFIPPLKDRAADIPILASHFIKQISNDSKVLTAPAMAKLQEHEWPGNIRELKNVLHRACLLAETAGIEPQDIIL